MNALVPSCLLNKLLFTLQSQPQETPQLKVFPDSCKQFITFSSVILYSNTYFHSNHMRKKRQSQDLNSDQSKHKGLITLLSIFLMYTLVFYQNVKSLGKNPLSNPTLSQVSAHYPQVWALPLPTPTQKQTYISINHHLLSIRYLEIFQSLRSSQNVAEGHAKLFIDHNTNHQLSKIRQLSTCAVPASWASHPQNVLLRVLYCGASRSYSPQSFPWSTVPATSSPSITLIQVDEVSAYRSPGNLDNRLPLLLLHSPASLLLPPPPLRYCWLVQIGIHRCSSRQRTSACEYLLFVLKHSLSVGPHQDSQHTEIKTNIPRIVSQQAINIS